MIEISERNDELKGKWSNLTAAHSEHKKLDDALHHEIMSHINGYGIKKYLIECQLNVVHT